MLYLCGKCSRSISPGSLPQTTHYGGCTPLQYSELSVIVYVKLENFEFLTVRNAVLRVLRTVKHFQVDSINCSCAVILFSYCQLFMTIYNVKFQWGLFG